VTSRQTIKLSQEDGAHWGGVMPNTMFGNNFVIFYNTFFSNAYNAGEIAYLNIALKTERAADLEGRVGRLVHRLEYGS
jgi:hypothetical protein